MDDEKPKGPVDGPGLFALRVPDNDLLSHGQSVLSSARRRFTVLFGMGRGGASGLWSSGIDGGSAWRSRRQRCGRGAWRRCLDGKGWVERYWRDSQLWSQAA